MLKYGMYAINDEKAKAFFNPFVARTKAEAHRSFGDTLKNPQSNLTAHMEDFVLYELGTFDPVSGDLEGLSKPSLVARGVDFKEVQK